MKKTFALLALSLFVFDGYSNSNSKNANFLKMKVSHGTIILSNKVVDCTVSATVSVYGTGVTVSSTKATCAEAVADVAAGVKAIKAQF